MSGAAALRNIPVRDIELEPWCCICGSHVDVAWCPWCHHYFCHSHRRGWLIWDRGKEALKQWLTRNPPVACPGARSHVGR